MNHLHRNFVQSNEYSDLSFLGRLHEKQEWNDDELILLENCIIDEFNKYEDKIISNFCSFLSYRL